MRLTAGDRSFVFLWVPKSWGGGKVLKKKKVPNKLAQNLGMEKSVNRIVERWAYAANVIGTYRIPSHMYMLDIMHTHHLR